VRSYNAGQGRDTVAGGSARLERDVFARGATVLIVAYGVNDIGWGTKADAAHRQQYLDAVRKIVEQCRGHKIRVFLCSAAITAENPDQSEGGFLQKMCDDGMALARDLGEQAIDVQRPMRAIQRKVRAFNSGLLESKQQVSLHAEDGIHLTDLGQLAMAFAILKGLGAPAEVSAVRLDATGPKLVAAAGCQVTDLTSTEGQLVFTRAWPVREWVAGEWRRFINGF
jgi:lysophospholipase L1-like esterase